MVAALTLRAYGEVMSCVTVAVAGVWISVAVDEPRTGTSVVTITTLNKIQVIFFEYITTFPDVQKIPWYIYFHDKNTVF
jgi:hypothetical protein